MNLLKGMERGERIELSHGTVDLYLLPEYPFWFVPSPSAHRLLEEALGQGISSEDDLAVLWAHMSGKTIMDALLDTGNLLRSFALPRSGPYVGRRGSRQLDKLSELWFHLTDACNLKCAHCLFGESLNMARSLEGEKIRRAVEEGYALGVRLVCFTGGEPFMYPGFTELIKWLLDFEDMRVAILTNGILVPKHVENLLVVDRSRLHLQVSLDGPRPIHDALRGTGSFDRTVDALRLLVEKKIPSSISMAVNPVNIGSIRPVIDLAADLGITTIHFQYHFKRGRGSDMDILPMAELSEEIKGAVRYAGEKGITVDNFEAIRSQVFSPPGTRFDLGNGCWESLAVGPDGYIYPTPAMVDREEFKGGHLEEGLENVWRNSPLFESIRALSLKDCEDMARDPYRFLTGGGDIDHCLVLYPNEKGREQNGPEHVFGHKGKLSLTADPYAPLYRALVTLAIEEEARTLFVSDHPSMVLRMGDVATQCPSSYEVNFVHCNCLLSMGEGDSRGLVRQFYSQAAQQTDETILNPVNYDSGRTDFIPDKAKVRMYGCGSPVDDADLKPGEVLVDLGSGTGVECFLASRSVGPNGMAIGVDMTDAMLEIAREASRHVAERLGYSNCHFIKGYLEQIPLGECSADVIISNCVINLSKNKRRVFQEIFRVLKPGGRIMISDVVTEKEPGPSIRGDHKLLGECIGGAMVEGYLFSMLRDVGFTDATIVKRFPYREIEGHQFYSITFSAFRPVRVKPELDVMYTGPFAAIVTESGEILRRGERSTISFDAEPDLDRLAENSIFVLDKETGRVTNVDAVSTCSCFVPPSGKGGIHEQDDSCCTPLVPETGCLICGAPLRYLSSLEERTCARCGKKEKANAVCSEGHFVCDMCHLRNPLEVIRKVCLSTGETDMIAIMKKIREHAVFPLHGPEHHAMVPGVILASYKNLGGDMDDERILAGIERGSTVPGGSCGFMGACGAAIGVGIAFSLILAGTPLTPKTRRIVQELVGDILRKIAQVSAARCCQRESVLALREAARASGELLDLKLRAEHELVCKQYMHNRECIRRACALYPEKATPFSDHGLSINLLDIRSGPIK